VCKRRLLFACLSSSLVECIAIYCYDRLSESCRRAANGQEDHPQNVLQELVITHLPVSHERHAAVSPTTWAVRIDSNSGPNATICRAGRSHAWQTTEPFIDGTLDPNREDLP
jgi:hypothetical protein